MIYMYVYSTLTRALQKTIKRLGYKNTIHRDIRELGKQVSIVDIRTTREGVESIFHRDN
jgi:hypothetical protein